MSVETLVRRHASLAQRPHFAFGGRRILAPAGTGETVAAILQEVNETVLGRTLVFEAGAELCIKMQVSGRRIMRIGAVEAKDASSDLVDIPLSDESQAEDLGQVLSVFSEAEDFLTVQSSGLERSQDARSIGLPASRIAELLDIDMSTPVVMPDYSRLDRFLNAAGVMLSASVQVTRDGETILLGPDQFTDPLGRIAATYADDIRERLTGLSDNPDAPSAAAFGPVLDSSATLYCASADGDLLVAIAQPEKITNLFSCWKQSTI
jgi:hypothetical protein